MGFLHAGHISLVEKAKTRCAKVVVSIFVNPTQFAAGEDLARYPRNLPRDLDLLARAGADLVFTPAPFALYPPGFATTVDVGDIAKRLEGASRPGHFSGVATVVTKLFNIVQPTHAFFGQKDAQQCLVVRRLVDDLNLPIEIVVGATIREPDGLAMSSRNSYLTDEQRNQAPGLYRSLSQAASLYRSGVRDADVLRDAIRAVIVAETDMEIDYVSVADPATLQELNRVECTALASLAVMAGRTRLIDNLLLIAEDADREPIGP
jgi:pantoate--beta-alanine ligase